MADGCSGWMSEQPGVSCVSCEDLGEDNLLVFSLQTLLQRLKSACADTS